LYFGRYYSSNAPEFAVLDTTSANPTLLGTSDVGTSGNTSGVYGLIAGAGKAFLLTGNTTSGIGKFLVMDATNPASISQTTSLSLPSGNAPVALDCEWNASDGKDYFYAASNPISGGNAGKGALSIITGS
jgi:hypothetical protein